MDSQAITKTVAPWIGTALNGPLNLMALEAASQALGTPDKTFAAVKQGLGAATPDQMLALRQADAGFAQRMQTLGFPQITDLEALITPSRPGGVAAAIEVDDRGRSRVPAILSVIVTVGYFGVLLGMMTRHLSVSDSQALLIMLGSLGTGWGVVMAFWFGTTHDNGRMTEMLSKAEPIKS